MLQGTVFPASESAELLLYTVSAASLELRNAAIFSSSGINAVLFRYLELANGQKCCISERLQPPLCLRQAFAAFSKLFF